MIPIAHNQVRLIPHLRINLLQRETTSMAVMKTVLKISAGAWGLASSVYLVQKGIAKV